MIFDDENVSLTEIADEALAGPELDAWLLAHPEAAREVEIARRVRQLMLELRAAEIEVPVGFEMRVMERVREDAAFLDLLDLGLGGLGRVFLDLLDLFFNLTPAPQASMA